MKFSIPGFFALGGLFQVGGKKVFVCLFVCLFFFGGGGGGIQKNVKIRGSACVSRPRSSAKVFFSSLSLLLLSFGLYRLQCNAW